MRFLRSALTALLALATSLAPAHGQTNYTTNVTQTSLLAGGTPVANAKVCATAVDVYGNVVTFSAPTWGLVLANTSFCGTVSAGAIAGGINVPDANHTNQPSPIHYNFTIQLLASAGGAATGPPIMLANVPNVSGTTYSLDSYAPSTSAPTPANVISAGPGVPGACAGNSLDIDTTSFALYGCKAGTYTPLASTGFNLRGAWAATTAYAVYDVFTYQGSSYVVTTAFTSGSTFSATNTMILAAAGATGPPGANGTVTTAQLWAAVNSASQSASLNLHNPATDNTTGYTSGGTISTAAGYVTSYLHVVPGQVIGTNTSIITCDLFDQNNAYISGCTTGPPLTIPAGVYFIAWSWNSSSTNVMFYLGSTAPANYVSYQAVDTATLARTIPSFAQLNNLVSTNLPATRNRQDPSQFVNGALNASCVLLTDAGHNYEVTSGFDYVADLTQIVSWTDVDSGFFFYGQSGNCLGYSGAGAQAGTAISLPPGTWFVRLGYLAAVAGGTVPFTPIHGGATLPTGYSLVAGVYGGNTLPSYFIPWTDYASLMAEAMPLAGKHTFVMGDSIAAYGNNAWVRYGLVGTQKMLINLGSTPNVNQRGAYASGSTYAVNDIVYSGTSYWVSLQASNTGHTPGSSPTWWVDQTQQSDVWGEPGNSLGQAMGIFQNNVAANPSGPSLIQQMANALANKDLCIFEFGTNDYDGTLGAPTDAPTLPGATGSFYAALNMTAQVLAQAIALTGRDIPVFFVAPYNNARSLGISNGAATITIAQLTSAYRQIGAQFGFSTIALSEILPFNSYTWGIYSADQIHPNDLGFQMMGNAIGRYIRSYFTGIYSQN